jgi:hypothetical protein
MHGARNKRKIHTQGDTTMRFHAATTNVTRPGLACIRQPLCCALFALIAALPLGACSRAGDAKAEAKKSAPAVPVLVGRVVEKSMRLRLHAIGYVESIA